MKIVDEIRRELEGGPNLTVLKPAADRHAADRHRGMTLDCLLATEFPELAFVIPKVLPEGLVLLGGRPKLGKSWLVLDWALAVALGRPALGSIPCEQGEVLLLALEDNLARLKDRFVMLDAEPTSALDVRVDWMDGAQAVADIERYLDQRKGVRMVVVDTLLRIRSQGVTNKDAYQADAQALEPLQRLAGERRIAIVAVTHTRKAKGDDYLDDVMGSSGVTATADAVLVLRRERGQADAMLHGTGRSLQELEMPLRFDQQRGAWQALDMNPAEARATDLQTRILDELRRVRHPGLTSSQLAALIERSGEATCNALKRLEDKGMVEKAGKMWRVSAWL